MGLSQVGDGRSQEIRRLLTDRISIQALEKLRGEGPSPLFYSPLSPSLMAVTVLGCPSLEESYPSLANQSSSPGPSRGQRWRPCQEDKLCLLSGLWS